MKALVVLTVLAVSLPAQVPVDRFGLVRFVRTAAGGPPDAAPGAVHRAAQAPVDVVGMRTITGSPQVWLMEAHGSFASVEAVDKALAQADPGGRMLLDSTSYIGLLRPGLSYRPEEALRMLGTAKFYHMSLFQTPPGAEVDFAEMMRIRKFGLDSVNLDRPEIGYQIVSGAPSGMYVFLSPLPSLQVLDQGLLRVPAYADGTGKATRQIAGVAGISREQLLFRTEPGFSYVSEAFAAGDPEFWRGGGAPR